MRGPAAYTDMTDPTEGYYTMTNTADPPVKLEQVVIRFAGDSGDGMQLTGDRFTSVSASFGNDLATLPDYPAEIRAPAGTLAGVSAFQIHISDHDILTPGDHPNVLVAMNPAALIANLDDLPGGGTVILNSDAFDERAFAKAGLAGDPRSDGTLDKYTVYEVPMTSLTLKACEPTGAKPRDAERSKNFFALGLISWMYTRPIDGTIHEFHRPVSAPGRPGRPPLSALARTATYASQRPSRRGLLVRRPGGPAVPLRWPPC